MRVAVVSWGASRGDFEPFLALAQGFQQAGHEVRFGAPPEVGYAEAAAQTSVPFISLGEATGVFLTERVQQRIRAASNDLKLVQAGIDEFLLPNLENMFEDCVPLARWADVLVASFIQPAGRMAADVTHCPFVTATYAPEQIPTRTASPMGDNLGPVVNRLIWKVVGQKINTLWAGVNDFRTHVGLATLRDIAAQGLYSPALNLVGASKHAFVPRADWTSNHQLTGHWFLQRPAWTPPDTLEAFLDRYPRPIAVSLGFGGRIERNPELLMHIVVEALALAQTPAIMLSPPTPFMGRTLPNTILIAEDIPFSWLLPRVSALIHHGGSGSTHQTFRAGIPAVVMPFIGDQRFWARTSMRLGIAPAPLPRHKLTPKRLAHAITEVMANDGYAERASTLGSLVRTEEASEVACRLVERLLQST